MTIDETRARRARWLSTFAFAASISLAAPLTFAQDSQLLADAAEDAEPVGDISGVKEEITVTGSRIKRTEFNTMAPIQIITSERSQLAGLLDATDILQGSTIASGQQLDSSFSGFVVDGGIGANSISLRGLGAQRTLVLVNGKRWGPSGVRGSTNSVDLTAIPTSNIARYEIFKDGASSVYGADAVAGVVNAITKQRIDGSIFNAQYEAQADGGDRYLLDGSWGRVGDNWSFNISGNYGSQEKTIRNDVDYAGCDSRPRTDGSGTDPATGETYCYGFIYGGQSGPAGLARYEPSLTDPTDDTNQYWDPVINGDWQIPLWTREPLYDAPTQGGYYRDTRNGEVAEMNPTGETYSINSFADFDFSIGDRSATAYYEFYYNKRSTTSVGGYRQFFPFVGADNPSNPMGNFGPLGTTGCDPDEPLDIPGTCGAGALTIVPSYANQDPTNDIEIERTNTFIGLKGDITETWTYEAFIGHSWSDGSYEQDNYLQGQTDASLDAELDGGGNLVCSAASLALYPDCVAGDLFTEDALLRGILPPDYIDFISKRTLGNTVYEGNQFQAYATGRLFNMPAGEVFTVFGYEWREESINDVPDQEFQDDNLWGRTSSGITKGSDTVNEFFTEIEVPLFKDAALAQEMTINASWRYTEYDSYGGDDTYRVGLNWQVSDLLLLRGTTGTSFRAPDLFEQFLANETGFSTARGNDVCIDYGLNYDPGTNVYDNCMADGLAPDFPGAAGVPSIRTVTGGNPNLLAETSDSWTAGFILTPEWVGASLAMSWFDIEIENTVQSPTPGFVIFDCYNSPEKSSGFCSRIEPRDNMGYLTDVDSSLLNVGLQRSKGLDIDILYEREFSTFDLIIDLSATHIEKQGQVVFDVASDYKGKWGYPDWVAQADFRIDYRDWTFFWNVNWIGSQDEDGPDSRICKTGTKTYNGASVRYRGQSDWEVIGSVRNIFETTPPLISDGCGSQTASRAFNTLPGVGYQLFGRTYVLQLSKGFNF